MPTSVTPKGVEHTTDNTLTNKEDYMPTSVTPKGVEHVPRSKYQDAPLDAFFPNRVASTM